MRRLALTGCLLLCLMLAGCGFRREEPPEPRPEQAEEPEAPAEQAVPAPPVEAAPEPAEEPVPEPEPAEFVRVADYLPDILVDLRYATADNFTGQVIYDFTDAYLRYGTVEKLAVVQETVAEQGYGLKIWDAFRPTAAQFALWEICPDGRYVANPNKGFSSHSRGNTVDLTLVTLEGEEVVMPTGFDDFTALADRDYSDAAPEAAENALLLETAMTEAGFRPYSGEWWHFSDTDSYEVEETFTPPARDDMTEEDHHG